MTPTLAAIPQWILVKLVPLPDGRTDKIPLSYLTAQACNAHEAANWTTYEAAAQLAAAWGPAFTVGLVITAADDLFCIDIDGAATPAGWSPLSQQIVAALPGCMIEVSQSGRGLHVWGRYPNPPPHIKKRIDLHIEAYTEGRFIAIGTGQIGEIAPRCDALPAFLATYFPPRATGPALEDDAPVPEWRGPESDDELLRRAMRSKSTASVFGGKASFADLWTADASVLRAAYPGDGEHGYDASSADAALAQHLAFWSGRHASRMITLMQRSGLRRDKYDRADYLPRTVAAACAQQRDVLIDAPLQPPPGPPPPPSLQATTPAPYAPVATSQAAVMTPVTGATYVSIPDQAKLFAGCVYIQDHHRVLVPGGQLLKPDQFRAWFGGYSFPMDEAGTKVTRNAWEAFTESNSLRAPRADGICFKPKLPFGEIINTGGRLLANTYARPNVPRRAGDAGPFMRHLAKLIPDEYERKCYLYWLCGVVQNQGHKAQWSPVLQGAEGNGKTLFARCVAKAIGAKHVHWPRADKLHNGFNAYVVTTTFCAVEEIKTENREDLLEILKPLITSDDGIEVEKKGVDQISAEICCNFHFTTNHKNALKKTANDRRFLVIFTAQQSAEDIERDEMGGSYMLDLYDWLKHQGGYEIVAEMLWTTAIPAEFDFTRMMQRAPRTRSYSLAVTETQGPVEQEILDAIERDETGFRGGWISSGFLDTLLERIGKARFVPLNKRRELLESLGYVWHPALVSGRVNNAVLPDGAKVKLFVQRTRAELMLLQTPALVADAYQRAQGVQLPSSRQ